MAALGEMAEAVMDTLIMDVGCNSALSKFLTFKDIHSMKVADLKRELKLHGLSTVGNKSDLIERLSQLPAFKTGDDASAPNEETNSVSSDEDEIDVSDDRLDFIDTKNSITENDVSEPLCNVVNRETIESITSTEVQKQSLNSEKKTTQNQNDKSGGVQEKKLLLKRMAISSFPVISHTPVEPVHNKSSEDLGKPKKVITPLKVLTSQERLQMRAKRFNLASDSSPEETVKNNRGNRRNEPLSKVTATPDVDVLKKRAARFGQSVSTVMKQIEEKEKVLKRKLRFGCSATASLTGLTKADEEEKKRLRAERFGTS